MSRSELAALVVLALVVLPICGWWMWHVTRAFGFNRRRRFPTRLTASATGIAILVVLACQFVGAATAVAFARGISPGDFPQPFGARIAEHLTRTLIQPSTMFLAATWGGLLGAAIVPLFLRFGSGVQCWEIGMHARRAKPAMGYGLALVITWLPAILIANVLVRSLIAQTEEHRHPVERVLTEPQNAWMLALLALVTAVFAAPLIEELVFRGLLQTWLCKRIGPDLAILASAILFGAAHSTQWPDPIPLTLLGIGLGEAYQRTRSLWTPIALHAGLNAGMTALAMASGLQ